MSNRRVPIIRLLPEEETFFTRWANAQPSKAFRAWTCSKVLSVPSSLIWSGILFSDHSPVDCVNISSHEERSDLSITYQGPRLSVSRLLCFAAILATLRDSKTPFGRPFRPSLTAICSQLGLTKSGKSLQIVSRHIDLLTQGIFTRFYVIGPIDPYFRPRLVKPTSSKVLQAVAHYVPLPFLQAEEDHLIVDARWKLLLGRGWCSLGKLQCIPHTQCLARLLFVFLSSHTSTEQKHSLTFLAQQLHLRSPHAKSRIMAALQDLQVTQTILAYEISKNSSSVMVWLDHERFLPTLTAVNELNF